MSDDEFGAGGPSPDVRGLRIWITGASRGLGLAIAGGLAARGARVAVTSRPGPAHDQAVERLRGLGGDVVGVPASVADLADVGRAAGRIGEEWGRLDGLVNAAGVSPVLASAEDLTDEDWHSVIATNLTGSFACARAAFPLLKENGGAIVNVTSVHGTVAQRRLSAYCASKGGLEMLTKALALDWAKHAIRVNALAPGYFDTEMTAGLRRSEGWRDALLARTPLGRFGRPEELVDAAIFLLSPASAFVTGSSLSVDGGWTAA